jgi:hypothetical protein
MSESISELLAKRNASEPPEIKAIKTYVRKHLQLEVSVNISKDQIAIVVPNAAAAGSLRMHLHPLKQELSTARRLVIRIG